MSVLPKNRQLVFSIRNYIRDTSEIFFISSLVKISLTSFLCFLSIFFFRNTHIYVIKRKLHVGLNTLALTREIFFPREDKLHMFAPPCNILSIYNDDDNDKGCNNDNNNNDNEMMMN